LTYPGYVVFCSALAVAHRYLLSDDSITSADQYLLLLNPRGGEELSDHIDQTTNGV
jgi:hypothetical protein